MDIFATVELDNARIQKLDLFFSVFIKCRFITLEKDILPIFSVVGSGALLGSSVYSIYTEKPSLFYLGSKIFNTAFERHLHRFERLKYNIQIGPGPRFFF